MQLLQSHGTPSGAHSKNQPEADMLAALGKILVAKELNDLEELLQMQVLLACNNINHVVEVILVLLQ